MKTITYNPETHAVVPIEPTDEMLKALTITASLEASWASAYKAMLNAAPAAEEAPQQESCKCTNPWAHDQCVDAPGCKIKKKLSNQHAAPAAEEAPQQEPDWTNSETLPTELWKNTRYSLAFRLKVADGAVAFERRVVENLRSQLKQQPATHGEPVAIVVDAYDTPGLQWLCQDPPSLGTRLYASPQPTPIHIKAMQMALEALEAALSDDQPYIAQSKEAITALQNALKGTP